MVSPGVFCHYSLVCSFVAADKDRGDLFSSAMLAVRPNFGTGPLPASFQDFSHRVPLSTNPPRREPNHNLLTFIFHNLRHLTARMPKRSPNPMHMMALYKARSSVVYSLLCLSPFAMATNPSSIQELIASDPLFEVRRLGALLYAEAAFVDCAAMGAFVRSLQSQLLIAIRMCDATWPGLLRREKSLAMWIYCTAGLFSLNAAEQMWFARRTASAMNAAEISGWHEVEKLLREIMWTDKLTSKVWRHLWPRVKAIQDRGLDAITGMSPCDNAADSGDPHR